VNTVHGNLEFIDDQDAHWMARAQSLFFELQGLGRIHTFGGIPGDVEPYGYGGVTTRGSVYVVMNPGQTIATIKLPKLARGQSPLGLGRVQFRDAGFEPQLRGMQVSLGPGQMAMIGFGAYASPNYDFGIQSDVVIPRSISPFSISFRDTGAGSVEASVVPPSHGVLRVIAQEMTPSGQLRRTWAGGPPSGQNMGKVFGFSAAQNGRPIPVRVDYDKVIWSGLSWAVGEINLKDLTPGTPILLRFHSAEKDPIKVKCTAYLVEY